MAAISPGAARTTPRDTGALLRRAGAALRSDAIGAIALRRLVGLVPLLFVVSVAAFSLTLLLPGNAAVAIVGPNATATQIHQAAQLLHLNEPAPERYLHWVEQALQGNLGTSVETGQSVSGQLAQRFPITFSIAFGALLLAALFGLVIGLLQAAFAGRWLDRVLLLVVTLGLSVPNFWLAALLVSFFAVHFSWFPAIGYVSPSASITGWLNHITLPILALSVYPGAEAARQIRGSLVQALERDYIRAAQARGVGRVRLVCKHALKNAASAAVTILGLRVGYLIAGSVIIESVFVIPGLGAYTLQAIQARDAPVIIAIVMLSAITMVVTNLLVDIAQILLNPRVKIS